MSLVNGASGSPPADESPTDSSLANNGIQAKSLSFEYPGRTVLNSVSLDFGTGVNGILGPNGAGKTTLLRILATAMAPQSGSMRICGIDPWQSGALPLARSYLGYLPQQAGFYPRQKVDDFLTFIALLKGISSGRERRLATTKVLNMVDLAERAHEKIGNLSGGMRQRLALGSALIGNPQVIILDEPTVGLDPEQRAAFRELISSVGSERVVILSTHQTEDILALCKQVCVLKEGEMIYQGSTDGLVEMARGRVWESSAKEGQLSAWLTGSNRWRNLGTPPAGAHILEPSVDDGYIVAMASIGANDSTGEGPAVGR